ncbi:MAG: ATP-dependent RecD-like DNA helicase [Clostridiales bacterium]
MIEIEGFIEELIYENKNNGYKICGISTDKDFIVTVGYMPGILKGEYVRINGVWVSHPEYGDQISIKSFERIKPKTREGLKEYLTSGIFTGIGKTTANRIINKFGDDTFNILQNDPQKLSLVKGISVDKALEIKDIINSQKELTDIISTLQNYKIDQASAFKLYNRFGSKTLTLIRSNPYILVDESYGISFKNADKIAIELGVSQGSEERIKSGIIYILNDYAERGNTYIYLNYLKKKAIELLEIDVEIIENIIINLNFKEEIYIEKIDDEERVYIYKLYFDELYVSKKLFDLEEVKFETDTNELENIISNFEKERDIELSSEQSTAVVEAVLNGVMVITGGPGTGKTTIVRFIIDILEENGLNIILTAPTGRASKKLTESSGREAKTIHRLLEANINENDKRRFFLKGEKDPIETDVIIVDEVSMVDIRLMCSLLKAVKIGTKVIFVGDIDQLPSVGPGNVLKDIINSSLIKTIKLKKVFRQAKESMIIVNAHRINKGEFPHLNVEGKDFFFIEKSNSKNITETVSDLCHRRLPNKYKYDPFKDIQVLSPMRKGETGIINLNIKLQDRMNPDDGIKESLKVWDSYFRIGDRVMQIKNNYNVKWYKKDNITETGSGVFNGDTGIIESIDKRYKKVLVLFDDLRYVEYDYTNFEEIEKSYAITIHKSQGSEYPVIIIPLYSGPNILMTRNLLYTAITRAKDLVVIVGKKTVLESMIKNEIEIKRFSSLREKIVSVYENNS